MARAESKSDSAEAEYLKGASSLFPQRENPAPIVNINDSSLTPPPFHGKPQENCRDWFNYFNRYVTFKHLPEARCLALFALLMRDAANIWYSSLDDDTRSDYKTLIQAFAERYTPAPISRWKRASEFWSRDQRPNESVEEYYADMMNKARDVGTKEDSDMIRYAVMRGLRPALRTYVMQQNPTTVTELLEAAKIAEATVSEPSTAASTEILEAINRLEQRVTNTVTDNRRVRFSPSPSSIRRDVRQPYGNRGQTSRAQSPASRRPWSQQPAAHRPLQMRVQQQPLQSQRPGCTNCARMHLPGNCVAKSKTCYACGRIGHLAICCRSRRRPE